MNKRLGISLGLALATGLMLAGLALAGNGPAITWSVMSGGGAHASGANITLDDTLGQPVIGSASGGNIDLSAGYWHSLGSGQPTAVKILYFHATTLQRHDIQLAWATGFDPGCSGFNLYRSAGVGNTNQDQAVKIHYERAANLGDMFTEYTYVDQARTKGEWWYWLTCVDFSGVQINAFASGSAALATDYVLFMPQLLR